ncbi:MAG: outer membrane beta-barrel protein [Azonexus sp.]|nr:outer membrane beta-barrel protein [Azonexus sp.]
MAALALAVASSAAMAADDSGVYVLASIGQSKFKDYPPKMSAEDIEDGLLANGDDKDTAWKLQVGYQFNKYFALEGGYFDLGEASQKLSIPDANISGKETYESNGFNLSAVGMLPLGDSGFSLFGKLGVFTAKTKQKLSLVEDGDTYRESLSDRKTGVIYGLGALYNITPQLAIRAEYEIYNKVDPGSKTIDGEKVSGDDSKVNVWSVGLSYRF